MADLDRLIAGLRCREILGMLADYVDGQLSPDLKVRVDQHLRECRQCEKFGGEYSNLVARLRKHLPEIVQPEDIRRRVVRAIDESPGRDTD